eukprot:1160791-Prymnesium_polylepis.2
MAMLVDATGRLLGAKGLYAQLPRYPLASFVDAARPAVGNTLTAPVLQFFMAVVHLSGISSAEDEKLERACKMHFEAC